MDGFQNATVYDLVCVFSQSMSKHCHITFFVGAYCGLKRVLFKL